MGCANVVPVVFSAASRVPGMSSNLAIAAVTTMGYAGFMSAPPVLGFVADGFGLATSLGVVATMGAAIMMIARIAQFAAFFGGGRDDDNRGNPIGLLLTIILAPLAAMVIQAAISRSREFAADAGAAQLVGSPYGLVDALKKIWDTADRHKITLRTATFAVACERILIAREERGLYP